MAKNGDVKYPTVLTEKFLESGHARSIKDHETRFAESHDKFIREI